MNELTGKKSEINGISPAIRNRMRGMKRLAVIVGVLASVSFAASAAISGTIYDIVTGKGLSEKVVFAEKIDSLPRDSIIDPMDSLYFSTVTNEKGDYSFTGLPPGMYSVYVNSPNYFSYGFPEVLDINDGIDQSGIDIALNSPDRDTFSVSGEVQLLESFGYPWFGEVMVFSNNGQIIGGIPIYSLDSIPSNPADTVPSIQSYSVESLPPVACKFESFVYGYLPQYFDHVYEADTAALMVRPGTGEIDFLLEMGTPDSFFSGEISGNIRGTRGPLPYASVYAKKGTKLAYGTISDYYGFYYIFGLEPGTYTIYATRPGYYTGQYKNNITVADSPVSDINITLTPKDAVEEPEASLHDDFGLEVFPNPFALNATIRYLLTRHSRVSLKVYDVTGMLVGNLFEGSQPPGKYDFSWNGTDSRGQPLPPGVYFIRLEHNGYSCSKSLVVIR